MYIHNESRNIRKKVKNELGIFLGLQQRNLSTELTNKPIFKIGSLSLFTVKPTWNIEVSESGY